MGHYYIDPDAIPSDKVKDYEARTCLQCSGSGKVPGHMDTEGRGQEQYYCGKCGGGGSIYVFVGKE